MTKYTGKAYMYPLLLVQKFLCVCLYNNIYAVSYAFKIYLFCQYITDNYYIYLVLIIRYCARFFFLTRFEYFIFKLLQHFAIV